MEDADAAPRPEADPAEEKSLDTAVQVTDHEPVPPENASPPAAEEREELVAIGQQERCQEPPEWTSDAFRDLQDASFFDRRPGGAAPAGELLGPAGPLAIKSAAQPPRQQLGAHSLGEAWKGETWRAPFKAPGTPGSPAGAMGAIRSRLLDDGDADIPPERSSSLPAPPPGLPQQRVNGGGDKPWQRAWRGGGGEDTAAPAGSPNRGRGTMERGGMPIGPRGPGAVLPGRGRGMGPPAEWNGRVGSAEQRGGFMQRAPPAGPAAPKTPADSDGDWRKAKEAGRQPEPTREWQQHGVGPPGRPGGGGDRRSDTGGGGVWDDEPSAGASRPRMTPAEMEEERKRMQEEFRNRKHVAVTHVDQGAEMTDDDWAAMMRDNNEEVAPQPAPAPTPVAAGPPPGFENAKAAAQADLQGEQAAAAAQPLSAGKAEGSQRRGSRFTKFFKSEAEAAAGAPGTASSAATVEPASMPPHLVVSTTNIFGNGAPREEPPPPPPPEPGTIEHFLGVGGNASQRAAKPLQPFNFAALAKAVPGAAPLPAIPPSARTLDELEGRGPAGAAPPAAASPGVPPGFAANGPAAHRPSQQALPPGAPPAAGDMPGANLLSLLNPGLRQPTAAAAAPEVPRQASFGQVPGMPADYPGGSLAALLQGGAGGGVMQRPPPVYQQQQQRSPPPQPFAGSGGTGLLAMLQGVRQDAGPPPPPAPQMQPQVAPRPLVNYGDRGADDLLALLEQRQAASSRGSGRGTTPQPGSARGVPGYTEAQQRAAGMAPPQPPLAPSQQQQQLQHQFALQHGGGYGQPAPMPPQMSLQHMDYAQQPSQETQHAQAQQYLRQQQQAQLAAQLQQQHYLQLQAQQRHQQIHQQALYQQQHAPPSALSGLAQHPQTGMYQQSPMLPVQQQQQQQVPNQQLHRFFQQPQQHDALSNQQPAPTQYTGFGSGQQGLQRFFQ